MLDYSVIASIVTGERFVDDETFYQGLEYLIGEPVTEDNLYEMSEVSKSYILETYSFLEDVGLLLKSLNQNGKAILFDLLNKSQTLADLSNVEPIPNLDRYLDLIQLNKKSI